MPLFVAQSRQTQVDAMVHKSLPVYLLLIVFLQSVQCTQLLGVPPSQYEHYNKNKFECLDSTQILEKSMVNDEYCDCDDGSDEPATSACSHTSVQFYCENPGFISTKIPNSRVNDGVCDCCDGSDEYKSSSKCVDTCEEQGHETRMEIQSILNLTINGYRQRLALMEVIQEKVEAFKRRQQAIQSELTLYHKTREEIVSFKQIEEEKERVLRLQAISGKKSKLGNEQTCQIDGSCTVNSKDEVNNNEKYNNIEQQSENDGYKKNAGHTSDSVESSEMRGLDAIHELPIQLFSGGKIKLREYLSNDKNKIRQFISTPYQKGDTIVHSQNKEKMGAKQIGVVFLKLIGIILSPIRGILHICTQVVKIIWNYTPLTEYISMEEYLSNMVPEGLENVLYILNLVWDAPVDLYRSLRPELDLSIILPEAQSLREIERHLDNDIIRLDNELKEISKMDLIDYGPSKVFLLLSTTCIEKQVQHYTYKFCPFHNITQNGVVIGTWSKWGSNKEQSPLSSYTEMIYENGATCWQGHSRSMTVQLKCGATDEILSIEEPSVCIYTMDFQTPAACTLEMVNLAKESAKKWGVLKDK